MPQKTLNVADRTLDDLEGVKWGPPTFDSYVVINCHRLRRVPLKQYRLEDLRLMIGQEIGIDFLVPRALDHIEEHPLASGDCYPGDVLASVARLPNTFWSTHRELIPRAVAAIDGALARMRKRKVVAIEELSEDLRSARIRLLAIDGDPSVT